VNKILYWGSCKRKFEEQNPMNQTFHVISYFNNRSFSRAEEWNFQHIFLFLSPMASKNEIDKLLDECSKVNQFLDSSSNEIEKRCQQHFSNTLFKFNSVPPPAKFFQVSEFRVYDFSSF